MGFDTQLILTDDDLVPPCAYLHTLARSVDCMRAYKKTPSHVVYR